MARAGTAAARSNLLVQIPYFAGLDSSALTEIGRVVRRRTFAAGEIILVEGKSCEGLYFVIEGQVRLIRGSAEGREHVLRVLGPGATFNDVAVFDGGPNSDGAVAIGTTTVGFIPKANMMALVDRHPQVAKAALKLLSSRQRTLGAVVEDLALRDVTTGWRGYFSAVWDSARISSRRRRMLVRILRIRRLPPWWGLCVRLCSVR